jgi:hypothetical protein
MFSLETGFSLTPRANALLQSGRVTPQPRLNSSGRRPLARSHLLTNLWFMGAMREEFQQSLINTPQGGRTPGVYFNWFNSFQKSSREPNLSNSEILFDSLICPYFYGGTAVVPPPAYNSSRENVLIDLSTDTGNTKLMKTESNSAREFFAPKFPNRGSSHSSSTNLPSEVPLTKEGQAQSRLVKPSQTPAPLPGKETVKFLAIFDQQSGSLGRTQLSSNSKPPKTPFFKTNQSTSKNNN